MTNEEPKNENEVTPEGAVEVDEEALDQAAGGASLPLETVSLNYSKIVFDTSTQRVGSTDAPVAPLKDPQQKF